MFPSLSDALHAGFQVFRKSERGYVVRIRTSAGWLFADVDVAAKRQKRAFDHLKSEGKQPKR
jgi:hypothetical protein